MANVHEVSNASASVVPTFALTGRAMMERRVPLVQLVEVGFAFHWRRNPSVRVRAKTRASAGEVGHVKPFLAVEWHVCR